MQKTYGPDVGAFKGNIMRHKPDPVVLDYIEVPREILYNHCNISRETLDNHWDTTLCNDGMKINGVPLLTIVLSQNIMYRTAEWDPHQTNQAYRSVFDNVFCIYNKAGLK